MELTHKWLKELGDVHVWKSSKMQITFILLLFLDIQPSFGGVQSMHGTTPFNDFVAEALKQYPVHWLTAELIFGFKAVNNCTVVTFYKRRFTKRLRRLSTLTYNKEILQGLGLQSLESRRLQFDLIYAYKILTGRIDKYYIDFHPTVIPVHAGSWL